MPRSNRKKLSTGRIARPRKPLAIERKGREPVPGPSTNPATNLLIADIGFRAAARLFRRTIERGMLRLEFPKDKARDIVAGRSLKQTLVSAAAARVATRSVPGALLVAGGLFAKTVVDRSLARRQSRHRGMRELEEQAENAD